MIGLVVIVLAVVAALGFGTWRAYADGRFRGTRAVVPEASDTTAPTQATASVLADTAYAGELGERATLLQFSSAFCAPCRSTRRTLAQVAEMVPGVAHIEVDAEDQLDLVRRIGVLRTPTTLVLDGDGRELSRASGAPSKPAVIASLGWLGSVDTDLEIRDGRP